jgi:hypothetical protein
VIGWHACEPGKLGLAQPDSVFDVKYNLMETGIDFQGVALTY